MPFQFLCPQGHLLQGDEAHMGMQCQCPQCGTAFIIPTIAGATPGGGQGPMAHTGDIELAPLPEDEDLEQIAPPSNYPAPASAVADLEDFGAAAAEAEIEDGLNRESFLHIPCPNGHELETPMDMVGQRAQCPECGVEFRLKREKSREYLLQQEILERRQGNFWFQVAVWVASFVVVLLIAIFVMMAAS